MNSFNSHSDALDLLRRANPVLRQEVADRADSSIAVVGIIERAGDRLRDPERRLVRRRVVSVALLVLALLVVAAPALALRSNIVSFFSSPPPPQSVQTVVYRMAEGAPAGMDPGLIPDRARVVTSMQYGGVTRDLWVAPTKAGGLCYGWVGLGGGCDKFGTLPLDVSWGRTADGGAIAHVDGFVHWRYADNLELRFADGTIVRPPLTRVTAPIDAAFFSVDVPKSQQDAPHTLVAVSAVKDGEVVSTQEAPIGSLGRPNPLLDAEFAKSTHELAIKTAAGEAAIVTAPTRYGGRCVWLELAGQRYFVAYCEPARYSFDSFSIQPIVTDKTVLLAGTIGGSVDRLEIQFADGDRTVVKPSTRGFALYSIPPLHLTSGHEAELIAGLDRDGTQLTSYRLPRDGRCYSSLPKALAPAADCPNAPLP
ncbi:MAG: hypothetical protein H0W90_15845 [Actinobacteria bacterium]|nr:hypothetical protein [Actinomycetota bacterium]